MRKLFAAFPLALAMISGGSGSAPAGQPAGSAYDFAFQAIDGPPLPLNEYRGKVVLVVNTASQCGFTGQYKGLQALWDRYRDRGLVVVGVPSNDFGGQEPGNNQAIQAFCELNYGVTFPLASKTSVSGPNAHPFYQWARQVLGDKARPMWNFHKYLVSADGRLVHWFATPVKPLSTTVTSVVERELSGVTISKPASEVR